MDADTADGLQRGKWYADRQLVPDEATGARIALYKSTISNPETDKFTRVSCLAKLASVLDLLPAVRMFDSKKSDGSCGMSTYDLMADRAGVYGDLAAAQRMTGDIHGAAHMYDRAAGVSEALIKRVALEKGMAEDIEDIRTCATNTLLRILDEWADVEQALGRNSKSDKLRQRAEKWRTRTR
ncbi:hypothetical protein GGI15_001369 [Coemansia interrupta]|uniref:Uncharacterized protein n=1 Tax=Coemansia interrupta TaxID=1126814 RepID=A0A9W8HK46_9FUNG|nr:hypothetical protein GGI15_001369 [Coemansia interrupta]